MVVGVPAELTDAIAEAVVHAHDAQLADGVLLKELPDVFLCVLDNCSVSIWFEVLFEHCF